MKELDNNRVAEYFSDTADQFAQRYNHAPDFQERFIVWTELLDRHAADARSAIDLGCGSGIFTFYLAGKNLRVVGIDASIRMIELCREEARKRGSQTVQFFKSELPKLQNVKLEKADLIISSSVLEYVENLDEAFEVMRNLLARNGTLIVSFPNSYSIYRWIQRFMFAIFRRPRYYRYVKNVLSADTLRRMLGEHGLQIQEIRYYAHRSFLLKFCKALGFPEKYTENLFVAVVKNK